MPRIDLFEPILGREVKVRLPDRMIVRGVSPFTALRKADVVLT